MIEMVGLGVLAAHSVLGWLGSHAHWFADKGGGAIVSQGVKEGWELIRKKLSGTTEGAAAIAAVEKEAGSAESIEQLRKPLEAALTEDQDFAKKMAGLVVSGSENLIQVGNNNKAAKVTGSKQVSIRIG